MRYKDQLLPCPDCARKFRFTAIAQRLSDELGYDPPRLCEDCRLFVEAARR
jgi:hypothetical protein